MTDNKSIRGPRDREEINIHESYEIEYWTKELGVTEKQLRDAVKAVGPMVKDVKKHLGK